LNELALFAGAGGGILGGHLLGWRTIAAVEIEDYPRRVLLQRQADGLLPRFPIWDDICTFEGKPWRGKVDIVTGGFPCQDISAVGKGDGLEGERSGLWKEMARVIREVGPRFVFVENSPMLTSRGLGAVLGDLASMGFDARWGVLGADFAGLDHKRNRIWIAANSVGDRLEGRYNSISPRQWQIKIRSMAGLCKAKTRHDLPAPDSFGTANGMADKLDRLKAIGNGQVSTVAAAAWEMLK
jgi:DNA (cytosine-5)-methyltransferase 1